LDQDDVTDRDYGSRGPRGRTHWRPDDVHMIGGWIGGVLTVGDVRRVDFGYFVRPGAETVTGRPRVEPCLGYVIDLGDGVLLFDTGLGRGDPEVDAHYRPSRRPLDRALADVGFDVEGVRWVVNCHLHFDHCGGNPLLAGRPIFTQRHELAQARTTSDYTMPELIDHPGAMYEELDGETEIFPSVWILATPGHTAGHQSLAIRCTDGTVVLAGQAHDSSADFGSDQLAARARRDGLADPLPVYPAWIDRLMSLDPARVLFAHDQAVWEPAG
jgi:N-acyl homoserine lactone hydrolase